LLLTRYVSSTEFVESLPEPISDGSNMWFHKKYLLFLPSDIDDNMLLADIKGIVSKKFPSSEIKTNVDKEKNVLEHSIYIDSKNILTISIQKFSENFSHETTSEIKTSLSTNYPVNKFIKEYFEPVIFPNQNIQEEKSLSNEENNSVGDKETQKPKVAIILDDGGYRNPEEDPALELLNKLNISILPDTRYNKELAKKAQEKGFEIMLHMPMQTKQGVKKGSFPCELLVNMSEKEIEEKTENALEQIPDAKGVNNHTGGVFTLKEVPLKSFMKVLKEKKMFFVDSVVVGGSKAYQVAKDEGVPALQRDIFLDHEYTTSKIKESLEILKKIAKKKGKAIGIGHFRDLTIKVLKEELPKFEEQGFELVHVSEMFE
ncbi:MAG TPA: divergent polysaccharide deacetylase family protein, partial [Candidatus Hydrogenedens sp.]|nr:divergent polysaccharide deacetylase family protein [Candidatus Hydrogenedens sp.]